MYTDALMRLAPWQNMPPVQYMKHTPIRMGSLFQCYKTNQRNTPHELPQ